MRNLILVLAVIVLCANCSYAFAQSIAGKWIAYSSSSLAKTGNISIDDGFIRFKDGHRVHYENSGKVKNFRGLNGNYDASLITLKQNLKFYVNKNKDIICPIDKPEVVYYFDENNLLVLSIGSSSNSTENPYYPECGVFVFTRSP